MDIHGSSSSDGGVEAGHDPFIMDPVLKAAQNLGATQQPREDPFISERHQNVPSSDPPGQKSHGAENTLDLQQPDDIKASTPERLDVSSSAQSSNFKLDLRDGTDVREHDHYPLDGPKNMVIFNFKNIKKMERTGSEKDVANLKCVFEQASYNVEPYEDLDQNTFLSTLEQISQREELTQSKIFVLVVLSHGNRTDGQQFLTSDGKCVTIDRVRTMFNDKHCPQLKGKPKIFLAAFCRRLAEKNPPESVAVDPNPADTTPSVAPTTDSPDKDFSTETSLKDLEQVGRLLSLAEENLTEAEIEEILQGVKAETVAAISAFTGMEKRQTSSHRDHAGKGKTKQETLSTDQLSPIVVRPKDFNDMMTLYACKVGYRCVRKYGVGSRFIVAFCQAVTEHGWQYNLDRLYTDVEIRMRKNCPEDAETMEGFDPDKDSTTFKTCYLF
ncbi:Caspase-like domain [Trinorchestia longiramus]|nr:Caspase-like domain [Trinorchestia longiramus]